MQEIWSGEPEERPGFRAIAISLAGLINYEGDIESELKAETRNCRKEHPYQSVQIPAAQQYTKADNSHIYSVLEEPVYNNYSREQSLAPPEEYEVPMKSVQDPEFLGASASLSPPVHYEIPELGAKSRSPSPPHYEVPELGASGSPSPPPIHYEVPDLAASASYCSQTSGPPEYEMPDSGTLMANGSLSSMPIDYEVPRSTPEREVTPRKSRTMDKKAQRKPEAPPRRSPARQNDIASSPVRIPRREPEALPRKSPARQNNVPARKTEPEAPQRRSPARMKIASSPVGIPKSDPEAFPRRSPARQNNMKIPVQIPRSDPEAPSRRRQNNPTSPLRIPKAVGNNEPYGMMSFEKKKPSSSNTGPPEGYLKLNYPAKQKSVSAPNSQEDHDMSPAGYSTLEWKRGKMVSKNSSNSNTLPSKFSLKSHVYHTLEPKGVQ